MFLDWMLDRMSAYLAGVIASPLEIIALGAAIAAALLTITSSFVKTMVPLRWLAVCSNFGFFIYGVLHGLPIVAVMHVILLPINMLRLRQMRRLTENVRAAATSTDTSGIWLRPYMKAKQRKKGEILFRKGDVADRLYLLASGRIEFVEIGHSIGPGTMFGELAFFLPHGRRTLTARCVEDCAVMSLHHETLRQIYYQNPSFGFELIGLVAGRLSADIARLEEQLAQAKAGVREL